MTDPRNIAHDKKVQQEKKHKGEDITHGATEAPQPGKKPHQPEPEKNVATDQEPATDDQNPSDKSK